MNNFQWKSHCFKERKLFWCFWDTDFKEQWMVSGSHLRRDLYGRQISRSSHSQCVTSRCAKGVTWWVSGSTAPAISQNLPKLTYCCLLAKFGQPWWSFVCYFSIVNLEKICFSAGGASIPATFPWGPIFITFFFQVNMESTGGNDCIEETNWMYSRFSCYYTSPNWKCTPARSDKPEYIAYLCR